MLLRIGAAVAIFVIGIAVGTLWAEPGSGRPLPPSAIQQPPHTPVAADLTGGNDNTDGAGGFSGHDSVAPQVSAADSQWYRLETKVKMLETAVTQLSARLDRLSDTSREHADSTAAITPDEPPQLTEAVLMTAGFDAGQAADIRARHDAFNLGRLYLRDQAVREGWAGTQQYLERLRELNERSGLNPQSMDPDSYDRYLYAIGEPNRVRISHVMAGSAAQSAGILPGDQVITYDDKRIFGWDALRRATTEGEPGELIHVEVERSGQRMDLYLLRGPLGVQLDMARVEPE